MSAHTPGPWEVVPQGNVPAEEVLELWIRGPNLILPYRVAVSDEDIANARLIAAAPDLLAALEEFFHTATERHPDLFGATAAARAAIAKATSAAPTAK